MRPYIDDNSVVHTPVGRQPIPQRIDNKPIDRFLTLTVNMKVALFHEDGLDLWCTGVGVVVECSPKESWERFVIPHSFFLIVKLLTVNSEFLDLTSYSEISSLSTMRDCIGLKVLCSGYKVRPMDPLTIVVNFISCQSTLKKVKLEANDN